MQLQLPFILLFGISGGEIFIIVLLILIFFGPKKIPEIARTLGKGINEIKKVQKDINAEINRYSNEIENPAKKVQEDIEGFKRGLYTDEDSQKENKVDAEMKETREPELNESTDDLPWPYNQNDQGDDKNINDVEGNSQKKKS